MLVEIRVYKQWDTDLVSLCDAGYSVSVMMRDAVVAYANGTPLHFFIDEPVDFDLNGKHNVHFRFSVPDSDVKTTYLLRNIKHGYRNTFCKAVLRNALIQQSLSGFFADPSLSQLHAANMADINLHMYKNVVLCSAMRTKDRQVSVFSDAIPVAGRISAQSPAQKRGRKKKETEPVQGYGGVSPFPSMPNGMGAYPYPMQGMPLIPGMMPWGAQMPQMAYQGHPIPSQYPLGSQTDSVIPQAQPNVPVSSMPAVSPAPSMEASMQAPVSVPVTMPSSEEQDEDVQSVDSSFDGVQMANNDALLNAFDAL